MTRPTFRIGSRVVGDPLDPYVIAEIGVNHDGNLELAKRLIDEAADGGAHAAKFQSYKAHLIASRYSPAYWDTSKEPTTSQFELFRKYDAFGPAEYQALAEHCAQRGIDFMSTPFDLDAVDMLAPLVPAFKVASADITNVPLIRKCAASGKPLIISTGASTLAEIEHALAVARAAGAREISLLHCVLNYPCPAPNAQLGMLDTLARVFPDCLIGYSDHVTPDDTISAMEVAVLKGAAILEKHFSHDKSLPGNDHYHAMNRDDLRRFMARVAEFRTLLRGEAGVEGAKDLSLEQAARRHARRSIVAARDLKAGEVLTEADLIAKRPAHGISPIHWDEVIGRTVIRDVAEDMPLQWDMLASARG